MNQVNEFDGPGAEVTDTSDNDIGAEVVRHWACGFKIGAEVLELGGGRGAIPQILIDAGLRLYLIDNSRAHLYRFQEQFPDVPSESSHAENFPFFGRTFDGVIVCDFMHLVPETAQIALLASVERVLRSGGRLLVMLPGLISASIGCKRGRSAPHPASNTYERILSNLGLDVQPGLMDHSGSKHLSAEKHVQAGVPN